jgi:hypothetical protein
MQKAKGRGSEKDGLEGNPRDVTWITVEISRLKHQGSEKCEVTHE